MALLTALEIFYCIISIRLSKDIDILQVQKKTTRFRELKLLNYTERMKALSNEPNPKSVQHQYSANDFCEALIHLLLLCHLYVS